MPSKTCAPSTKPTYPVNLPPPPWPAAAPSSSTAATRRWRKASPPGQEDATVAEQSETVTAVTGAGQIRGRVTADGILSFLGVPYAEPPVGSRRFEPPRRRKAFETPFDASEYGPTAPQRRRQGPLAAIMPNVVRPGEDFLNLNIWTGALGGRRPVMVFIHGGCWTWGSGTDDGYNGSRFARDGVVLVTINYRLGTDGFAWFGDGAPNLGLLDQISALEWVRDNIGAFGGDPQAVTVFGQSAGALSIGALLAMPRARGLFRRVIMQSGATYHAIGPTSARLVAHRLAVAVGVPPSREALSKVPLDELLEAQEQISTDMSKNPNTRLWGDAATNGLAFEPVIDGDTLPVLPIHALQHGDSADVDLLVGTNTEETMIAFAPSGVDHVQASMLHPIARRAGLPPIRALEAYRAERPAGRPVDHATAILTDQTYRIPALRTAETHPRAYVYEFAWRSPGFDGQLGACHGAELPFVFDNLDSPDWKTLVGDAPPQKLADRMHATWIRFARTGDPGWDHYDSGERVVMIFDDNSRTVSDPRGITRAVWSGRR
ncbi:carboxylesterase [Nocardia terpenica]|uniref:Carboxylic ester hydrolase n=1 Tax=Nocardia terpenica TaxID=455432 RepID=A0A291RRT2_9NOCA|nr:carboxylesterase [Nocardia terpenica]